MSDMVTWLRFHINTRRSDAVRASKGPRCWSSDGDYLLAVRTDGADFDILAWEVKNAPLKHIVTNDPRDVIARCDAELAILDEHYGIQAVIDGEWFESVCRRCSDRVREEDRAPSGNLWTVAEPSPCKTVRLIALGYQHRPGFKEEWRG